MLAAPSLRVSFLRHWVKNGTLRSFSTIENGYLSSSGKTILLSNYGEWTASEYNAGNLSASHVVYEDWHRTTPPAKEPGGRPSGCYALERTVHSLPL